MEETKSTSFNDRSDEGEVSGLRAILKIRGRLQAPERVAGKSFAGDEGKAEKGKAVKDQLKFKLTEAEILEMVPGQDEPELKDDTFTIWLGFALPGHNDASPQSAYKRAWCKSAEELNKKMGRIDEVTKKPFGWKKFVDEIVTLEYKDIKWKIDNETKVTKTWYFVEDDATPIDLDAHVAKLIDGCDPATALRNVVGDAKAKRDPKYKEAIKLEQPVAGCEVVDGCYKATAPQTAS
jgi:hypothetical protein